MTAGGMTSAEFERLLFENEGPALDFKRDQYRFAKFDDNERSELVKDILGMSNAWRRTEAFILIGVDEVRGGRAVVHGINPGEHLADHTLQQFLSSLTNRPLRFRYEALAFEGKQIGVVRVEQQVRPLYLTRDYGKLQKHAVYVRRGSSTDPTKPALPDEIAQMGRAGETLLADLEGLLLEIEYNKDFVTRLCGIFDHYVEEHGLGTNVSKPNPIPPHRFRLQAVQAYLQRPVMPHALSPVEAQQYWQIGSLCNGLMDRTVGLTTVAVVDDVIASVMKLVPVLTALGNSLNAKLVALKSEHHVYA